MSDDTTRRRFLAVTATTGMAALAGCLSGSGGGTATDTSTSDNMDGGMSPTGTPTGDAMTPTEFTVTVTNVSDKNTLQTMDGGVAVPLAPVAWALHADANPLFTEGEMASEGLEILAEAGSPKKLVKESKGTAAKVGAAAVPKGKDSPGPIKPGGVYEFTVKAQAGQRLSLATMFVQSNDLFYAPSGMGIPLFDADGKPMSGDMTGQLALWDAGTEVNQRPGEGADQAPRQESKDAGTSENKPVQPVSSVDDGFTYPDTAEVVKLTVSPGMNDG